MANLLKDSTLKDLKKAGSKEIIEAFQATKKDQQEIEISATGRDADTVYVSMGLYLQRHPDLRITVHKREGDRIFLVQHPEPEKVIDNGAGIESNLDS